MASFDPVSHVQQQGGSKYASRRRALGEANASSKQGSERGPSDFFDIDRDRVRYPEQLNEPTTPQHRRSNDPYAHLGRIGYTRNTYQFRGATASDNNIYGSQHMKKTAWLEEMRRKILAEEHGISADVDKANISGTASAYYLRQKKNRYIDAAGRRGTK